jgi:hypothetical protein
MKPLVQLGDPVRRLRPLPYGALCDIDGRRPIVERLDPQSVVERIGSAPIELGKRHVRADGMLDVRVRLAAVE